MIRAMVVSKFVAVDGLLRISQEREGQKVIALSTFYTVCTPLPENLELFKLSTTSFFCSKEVEVFASAKSIWGIFLSAEFKVLHYERTYIFILSCHCCCNLHIMVFNGV